MYPATDIQKRALLGSHQMFVKVGVLRGSTFLGDIPVESGTVSATYATEGGRDASIAVARTVIDQGFLNPLSDQVYIRTGIPGLIEVPIFTGRVDAHNDSGPGLVDVPLISRGVEAIRAGLEVPWAAQDGEQARNEIARLLKDVDNTWSVDVSRAQQTIVPRGLVWEDDRGQGLDQLARGASLIWQPDRTGGFTVYTNPFLAGTVSSVPILFQDGVNGTTVDVQDALSRDGIYNSVTVVAEKYGNQAPIRVTVRDNGALSPTKWGGLFGKQNLILKSQIPIDTNGAVELATRVLNQSLALQRSWTITTPHMPLLDPGDVFGLRYKNEVTTQVAESIDYTVNAQDPTVITSRQLRPISIEILSA